MEPKELKKIKRMTRLARPFLWNLCPRVYTGGKIEGDLQSREPKDLVLGKKEATYYWLMKNGFNVKEKDTYEDWIDEICEDPGVEQVFKRLIIPELKRIFAAATMQALREYWTQARIPDRKFVKEYGIDRKRAFPVLEIHWRFGYVHRFGALAPIIFEDAAEWLEDEGLLEKSSSQD
jgi:hypothetical protein